MLASLRVPALSKSSAIARTRVRAQGSKTGAVRPVPVCIITVSREPLKSAAELAAEYTKRIARYTTCTTEIVRPNPGNTKEPSKQKQQEAGRVAKLLTPRDLVVCLDERGKSITSEGFAALLSDAWEGGFQRLVFCIGGPFGHGDAILSRADRSISLSGCVLNHQVAHVVLCEQVYRGWTILRGEPYHH